MPTYGGDEVNALVIDVGSTWTRAGFAGEDLPRALFPSHVGYIESEQDIADIPEEPKSAGTEATTDPDVEMGDGSAAADLHMQQASEDNRVAEKGEARKQKTRKYFVGDTESATWRAGMEIGGPLEHGLVSDWDMYEKIWEYAVKSRLHVRPEEHPVMVSEAAWNTSSLRAKLVEMAFEKFNSPAFYVCKTPVLSAFGAGKHTALVVDVGGQMTSTCAVYEGFCLTKTLVKQEVGGELISEQILERLKGDYKYELTPLFDIKSKALVETLKQPAVLRYNREGTTESYLKDMRLRAMPEFKESVCEIIERPYDVALVNSKPQKPFEFPDGFNISVGAMRYAVPEILFNPNQFLSKRPKRLEGVGLLGVHEMAVKSVFNSDVDLRPQLLNNVVMAGGSTLFPCFHDRLVVMLQDACPGSRIKFYSLPSKTERKATAWLGGSVLASLGTFHQLWISRAEYDEHGASIVDKKCQ
ncbi:NuA4 histone acetyltransferase subunit [Coemansia aciculifera]|nr:NuA4 histone acetyltransferase subunit [Coemansia aciculifera]